MAFMAPPLGCGLTPGVVVPDDYNRLATAEKVNQTVTESREAVEGSIVEQSDGAWHVGLIEQEK
jgi:hypothetical protein